jgi:copper homeostasis protein
MLEVCVDEVGGIAAAIEGRADRIELCSALALGGLTPPASLIRAAAHAPIAVHLLARPREGDFHYGAAEAALVADDIAAAADAGLEGVVIGASDSSNRLDTKRIADWVAHARTLELRRGRPLSLTLHRAFDLCPDPLAALEDAIALGFDRILTSGGQPRAIDAVPVLADLVRRAGDRIVILAGSGIDATTLTPILGAGVREVHASCRSVGESADTPERRFGFQAGPRRYTDPGKVAALRALLDKQ